MKEKLNDVARLHHILDAIEEIETYIKDTDFDEFIENSMMKNATIKQLEIIGEASNHISEILKQNQSNVKWKEIIGLRNILIHEYFGVDDYVIWGIVTNDLTKLKNHVSQILNDISR